MHHEKQHVRPVASRGRRGQRVEAVVADILRSSFPAAADPVIVAIGGPGGTGKSSFARALARELGQNSRVLRLDDYKTARRKRQQAQIFGAHPDANKMELIAEHLAALRQGHPIEKPVYDSAAGEASRNEKFRPCRWTLVDGEVATYSRFRDAVDFAIFIDSDWRTQLGTRLGRDLDQRNYTPDKAVATFLYSNLREFTEHGAQSKNWADIHLFCHEDYRLQLESLEQDLYGRVQSLVEPQVEEVGWSGLIVPLLTPFGDDGEIDSPAFADHLSWLAASGVKRVLVGGTAGEFFSLTLQERVQLLKLALEYFPGLVLFQVGGGALADACSLAGQGQELGADGLLCLPSAYYAHAPADGLAGYFCRLAEEVEIPFLLYNFPRHTQNPITADILRRVPHFGVKDSSGDLSLIPATPRYFLGGNRRILDGLRCGAVGFVSAAANAGPEAYVALEQAAAAASEAQMEAAQLRILEFMEGFEEPTIPALKQRLRRHLPAYPVTVRPPL